MLKVILLVDNYNELSYLQTTLKNVGFDIFGLQRESQLEAALLSFRADVLIATGMSKKVNGLKIAVGLHKKKLAPKVILLFNAAAVPKLEPPTSNYIAGILRSPVQASDLLALLAQVGGLDLASLMEKHHRLSEARLKGAPKAGPAKMSSGRLEPLEPVVSFPEKSNLGDSSQEFFSKENCERRFERALVHVPKPKVAGIPHDRMEASLKELREAALNDDAEDLEAERKIFVKALFSGKSG